MKNFLEQKTGTGFMDSINFRNLEEMTVIFSDTSVFTLSIKLIIK